MLVKSDRKRHAVLEASRVAGTQAIDGVRRRLLGVDVLNALYARHFDQPATEFLDAVLDEVRAQGVNVNAVLPSLIDTPRNRADMPDADYSTWVDPNDLAAVVCFLASDAARAVHGALVPVSGLL